MFLGQRLCEAGIHRGGDPGPLRALGEVERCFDGDGGGGDGGNGVGDGRGGDDDGRNYDDGRAGPTAMEEAVEHVVMAIEEAITKAQMVVAVEVVE